MLQKRLDYGFNGYQVPFIPRAARSRRSGSVRKKVEVNRICPIDLLATVAGNLLLEGDASQKTSAKKDQAVSIEDVAIAEQHCDKVNPLKFKHCSSVSQADAFKKIDSNNDNNLELCYRLANVEQCSAGPKESCQPNFLEFMSENGHDTFFNKKSPEQIDVDCRYNPCGSLSPSSRDNIVKVVSRDDDENSSGCTYRCTMRPTRCPARIGARKIRKLLASKYHRMTPKAKNRDLSNSDIRYIYCSRKTGYRRQRSQRIYPFKKRKVFRYSSFSSQKTVDKTASSFDAMECGVNTLSSSVTSQSTSFSSKESHVKVRIKSFRVPELFIEMPETATIGSLKRAVMEALTTLLRGGMHVGVLLHGKKIRDDNRTLLQSGNEKLESLGFSLEPTSLQPNPPLCSENNSFVFSTDVSEPVPRCADEITIHEGTSCPLPDDPVARVGNLIESDHDSAPSPAETSVGKETVDSQALVSLPLPEETLQSLAVVPSQQRTRRSEMAQRRIRRPFSVAEVEALVQAVEMLGTGRWRDVKLRAFDNVKHRTYVDLKDKWKTLVHTARISPQQRRGQPVPQELLDRVLAAHAYWSQHQAKQQLKQQPDSCLLL